MRMVRLTLAYNALDLHIQNGLGDKTALIYDSPITGNKSKFTFKELKNKVSKFAGALKNQGHQRGSGSYIYANGSRSSDSNVGLW